MCVCIHTYAYLETKKNARKYLSVDNGCRNAEADEPKPIDI